MKNCASCEHAKPTHFSRGEARDPRCTHPDQTMFGQYAEGAPFARFYLTQREGRLKGNACGPTGVLWSAR